MIKHNFNFLQNQIIKKILIQTYNYDNINQIIKLKKIQKTLYLKKNTLKEILNICFILKLLTKKKTYIIKNKQKHIVGCSSYNVLNFLFIFKNLKRNKEKFITLYKNFFIIKNPIIFFNLDNNKYIKFITTSSLFLKFSCKTIKNEQQTILKILI